MLLNQRIGRQTVGVIGPWGSGKTSCLRIAKTALEQKGVTVIYFNPWLWSETGDLVQILLYEIRSVKVFLKAKGVDSDKILMDTPEDLQDIIRNTLRDWSSRLVVMVDDVDRLERKQLRDIFRAVRLTGNLPKVIYVIALDKKSVARSLDEDGFNGADYLEKIIKTEFPIPVLQREQKRRLINNVLDNIWDVNTDRKWEEEDEKTLIPDILEPLLQTLRDIKRYAMRVDAANQTVPNEVQYLDLLALEAMRLKTPSVIPVMERHIGNITVHKGLNLGTGDSDAENARKEMTESAGDHKGVVEKFIEHYLSRMKRNENETNWDEMREKLGREGKIGALPIPIMEGALGCRRTSNMEMIEWTRQEIGKLESGDSLDSIPQERIPYAVEVIRHNRARLNTESIPGLMNLSARILRRAGASINFCTRLESNNIIESIWKETPDIYRNDRVEKLFVRSVYGGQRQGFCV